jgi:hypothetical protein
MKKPALLITLILLLSQSAWGFHTAMIGGVRDGLALGLQVSNHLLGDNLMGRFILAGSTGTDSALTGENPLQLALGLKTRLYRDLWGTIGGIYYSGSSPYASGVSMAGLSLSFMYEDAFDIDPLFFEAGADLMSDHSHVVFMAGYRFIDDFSEYRSRYLQR